MTPNRLHDMHGHYGILAVEGPDATRMLQGQLSCDVERLSDGDTTLGSLCTPKGRMVADFQCARLRETHYLLRMRGDLLASCHAALSRYSVFYQLALRDDSEAWRLWGLSGPDSSGLAGDSGAAVRVSPGPDCAECWWPRGDDTATVARWRERCAVAGPSSWTLLAIRQGRGEVCGATSDLFIPQMLNLHQRDGISFDKGCYTGQEIIARAHYRGALKRRLYRAEAGVLPDEGSELRDMEREQNAGHVVLAAWPDGDGRNDDAPSGGAGRCELLAVLATSAEQHSIALADPRYRDGDFTLLGLVDDADTGS